MVKKALRSDASSQIAGFLYQFVVAVDYCFKLSKGQSLYIEKYGDVAIKGDGTYDEGREDTCIEVKLYSDDIDVNHHNLLNTLYNWLEDDFHFESYQTLLLYTTQAFSKDSLLKGWNDKSAEDKVKIVRNAYTEYLNDNKDKIEDKDVNANKSIKKKALQMKRVLGSVLGTDGNPDEAASTKRLEELLGRVVIFDSCKNLEQKYKDLLKYAKVAQDHLRETYIDALVGFLVRPKNMNDGWKIEEAVFTEQVHLLTAEMAPQSFAFPDAPDITLTDGEYDDSLFVHKLKEIDYERITDAVMDFARTTGFLTKEFERPFAEKSLADYQDELLNVYNLDYGNAKDFLAMVAEKTSDVVKNASRVLLRTVLKDARSLQFAPFGTTKQYFSNGMCHLMANDRKQNIKWFLCDE